MLHRLGVVLTITITGLPKMLLVPFIAAGYYIVTGKCFFYVEPEDYLAWPFKI